MYGAFVYGKDFEKSIEISWKEKIQSEKIEALDIYWYTTFDEVHKDMPDTIQGIIMQQYFEIFGCLPKWNIEF